MSVARVAVHGRRRARVTVRALVLGTVVVAFALAFVYPVRLYMQQRGQIQVLQHQTQLLTQENAKLQKLAKEFSDPAYLEQYVRRCLGFVPQGQTAYIVVPSGKSQPLPQTQGC